MDSLWGANFSKKERRGKRAELSEEVAKKLKSCSVLGCEEWRDLNSFTTYHCFPTGDKNQQRWEIWTSLLQRARGDEAWIPFRGSLVCSHHFRTEDFVQDPNQKRRKLIKNAIPSIFPTFTVDLSDPTYAVDDSDDGSNGNGNDSLGYYYDGNDYDHQEGQGLEDDSIAIPEVQVQYADDEIDEEQLQYISYRQPSKHQVNSNGAVTITKGQSPTARMLPKPPKLTPATSLLRKSETDKLVEPPQKKPAVTVTPVLQQTLKKPSMTAVGGAGAFKTSNRNGGVFHNSATTASSASKLYQQLCRTMSDNYNFPVSLNPDLEIEVVENMSDDSVDTLKHRIAQLEMQNETIRKRFGLQVQALQRKIREQDQTIQEYEHAIQSMQMNI